MNTNEKPAYVPPQCELLALHCEGVIALSPEYTAWPDQDWI